MKSRRSKTRNKIMLLTIIVLALSIGFATLATTLKINGTANIGKNSWDVYWDTIANKQGVTPKSGPTIGNDSLGGVNTQVNFEVDLSTPGDYFEFTVNAVNAGTLDAMIEEYGFTLNGNPITEQNKLPNYVKFTVMYADGVAIGNNHILPKAVVSGNTSTPTTETLKIKVVFDKDLVTQADLNAIGENGDSYSLGFYVKYSQADEHAIPKPIWALPQGKTASTLAVGDEICTGDQCFNFIKYNGDDVVMLAKYNLKVGAIFDSNADPQYIGEYTSSDPGYALQSSEVRGWIDGESIRRGTVVFSTANYWSGASSYPVDVYDPENHAAQPDPNSSGFPTNQNYSLAYYVEQYKTKLINDYHATIKDARLLTYQEATDSNIGCNTTSWTCPTSGTGAFITNTSFWVGSAADDESIWMIDSNGDFYSDYWDYEDGVRPVIVVAKSNL